MLEPFEHRGRWWLPDTPEPKVAGVLSFSQDEGGALELIGLLPRPQSEPDPKTGEVTLPAGLLPRERIVGVAVDGRSFTLERCRAIAWGLGGFVTENFAPDLILEGALYGPDEPVAFDDLRVRYTQLDAWVTTSGIAYDWKREGDTASGIDIAFRLPEPVPVQLPNFEFEVDFSWTLKTAGTSASLVQHAELKLAFGEPIPVERCLDLVYQLRNFIALGVGRPVMPTAVRGVVRQAEAGEGHGSDAEQHRPIGVNIFYPLPHVPEVKEAHPAEMLFTLADARDRFAQLVENWFAKQELLRPVFDLYFGAIYNRRAFLEQRFLSLTQAIETFHRRTSPATELPAEQHERRIQKILAGAPSEHQDWLSNKLTFSNELSLRRRLKDILSRCPEVVTKLLNKKTFVHEVLNARNYLTHYDPSLEEKARRGMDLYPLTVQLQTLVEMCLLLELGFTCAEVDGLFERVNRYREVAVD